MHWQEMVLGKNWSYASIVNGQIYHIQNFNAHEMGNSLTIHLASLTHRKKEKSMKVKLLCIGIS